MHSWCTHFKTTTSLNVEKQTSLASFIMAMNVSSSNSISFEILSLATPSKISSDFNNPAPTAANQQHINTYRGSPACFTST
ncbi:hypothetical protein HanPSC8_Chr15g0657231 [Helianthus annuus]|nr:hypothetical protein HanPSC8_Chr15g0657231 [Helianthus annuus]